MLVNKALYTQNKMQLLVTRIPQSGLLEQLQRQVSIEDWENGESMSTAEQSLALLVK